ncbi:hypothetical protein LY90DRAFT_705431 [Neocallimastix californiae]|uniref:G-protein coupled receptors family 3 profile domain-containing protein n=1 Tax=Neocallimastix californiae TaxID=1754190 RepID=A0A1Y2B834_9FUNG|nr:hypothetical protein LY90DRAFT_705431 [Neocallimastix californiae]|eukprot:ORY30657.1 hypothetical protein LY90DRAFT_705431 [Neocallimastix californiae]
MLFIFKTLYCLILYNIILFSIKTKAEQDKIIRILIKKPDIENIQDLNEYNSIINNYLSELIANDTILSEYKVEYSYSHLNNIKNDYKIGKTEFILGSKYAKYLRDFAQSHYVQHVFHYRNLYKKCMDLSNITSQYDLSYQNSDILNEGKFDGIQYGLPYEFDFDVFYYNSNNNNNGSINDLRSISPNDMDFRSNKIPNIKGLLSVALGDEDILLNEFMEYIHYMERLSTINEYLEEREEKNVESFETEDSDRFAIFNNDTLYDSFKHYLQRISGFDLSKTLEIDMEQALTSFLNNETPFFKGKGSYYNQIFINTINNNNFSLSLLPNNYTVTYKNYLVINNKSTKERKVLEKFAYLLTSEKMQYFRAKNFGNIPTFITKVLNLNQTENSISKSYCENNAEICKILFHLHSIPSEKLFMKNKYNIDYLKEVIDNTINMKLLTVENIDMATIALYVVLALFVLSLTVVMVIVYQNRKHPYLKVISPSLCNLIIFGLIMNLIIPLFLTNIRSVLLCKTSFIFGVLSRNIVILPMFAIIFRIFYIYTNKSEVDFGAKLNNKRLFIYILIFLFVVFCYCIFTILSNEFYIVMEGNIIESRTIYCYHTGSSIHLNLTLIYYFSLFSTMLIMMIKSGKATKKHSEVNFIYIIVLLLLISFVVQMAIIFLPQKSFSFTFLVVCIIYMSSCALCVYLLVGSRLLYIFKHPISGEKEDFNFNNLYNIVEIADFVPLKNDGNNPYYVKDKLKNKNEYKHKKNKYSRSHSDNPDYIISNNPNNFFFNQSLNIISQHNQQNQKN